MAEYVMSEMKFVGVGDVIDLPIKPTSHDKMRLMTDEKFAEWLKEFYDGDIVRWLKEKNDVK